MFGLGSTEIILIGLLIIILFGVKKIPEMMKGIGKGMKEFKNEINSIENINKN